MWFNYFADGDEEKEFLGTFECRVDRDNNTNSMIVVFKDVTGNDCWAYATEEQVFPSKYQALVYLSYIVSNKADLYNKWRDDLRDEINSLPF
jgi:hypothetical protein